MPLTLYVATGNAGKLRDFGAIAESCSGGVEFLPLPGLPDIPAPPEDGLTFEENARAKAMAYSRHGPGLIVLADDSGLEVDALGGGPGVRSARYAEDAGFASELGRDSDARNNLLLRENLKNVPEILRTARYHCVLAAVCDGECIATAAGTVEGRILEQPRGKGGFGYDPLFYLPALQRTMAEISLEEKFGVSHRGRALRALLRKLSV